MWLVIDKNRDGKIDKKEFISFLNRHVKFLSTMLPEVEDEILKPEEV